MIQLSRNYSLPEKKEDDFAIKIVGVGGAGANALDRIVLDGMENAEMVAVNTDVQSLASSVATQKVQIGRAATRGLGAGGDPELGFNAAHESADELREVLQGGGWFSFVRGWVGERDQGRHPSLRRWPEKAVRSFSRLPRCPLPSKANAVRRRRRRRCGSSSELRMRWFASRTIGWGISFCRRREFIRHLRSLIRPSARVFARLSMWSGDQG
jgi:hypothetical protein